MILTPIGRDNAVIQRHAWVTYGIVALNVLAFAVVNLITAGAVRKYTEDVYAIEVLISSNPGVILPKQLELLLGKAKFKELSDEMPQMPVQREAKEGWAAQKRLDELAVSAVENYRRIGQFKYSYLPLESSLFKVFISMWVQFSFLALLSECLVLFSTAPYLEDVFGRPAFAILYVGGAFASATAYQAWFKNPQMGLFGASGAVAPRALLPVAARVSLRTAPLAAAISLPILHSGVGDHSGVGRATGLGVDENDRRRRGGESRRIRFRRVLRDGIDPFEIRE